MNGDQDRRKRGKAFVRFVQLVDDLTGISGGKDKAEGHHSEQHEARPPPEVQQDCSGQQYGEDDGDDAERKSLGVDTQDLRASFAVHLLGVSGGRFGAGSLTARPLAT